MVAISRLKNILIARLITRWPSLAKRFVDSYTPWESEEIPWSAVSKPLGETTVAVVTTAGVHHREQEPFNMIDPHGDPSYRLLDLSRPLSDLMITHDYYDHSDADKDLNVVFPIERLREFAEEGVIGGVARHHVGFMGHVDGPHLHTLVTKTGPEVAGFLRETRVDAVLLTPG